MDYSYRNFTSCYRIYFVVEKSTWNRKLLLKPPTRWIRPQRGETLRDQLRNSTENESKTFHATLILCTWRLFHAINLNRVFLTFYPLIMYSINTEISTGFSHSSIFIGVFSASWHRRYTLALFFSSEWDLYPLSNPFNFFPSILST